MNRNLFWTGAAVAGVAAAIAYKTVCRMMAEADRVSRGEEQINDALDGSFPASDPPSYTPTAGSRVNVREAF